MLGGVCSAVLGAIALIFIAALSTRSGWCLVHKNDFNELCNSLKDVMMILNENEIKHWL
jgi:hypothetical protein